MVAVKERNDKRRECSKTDKERTHISHTRTVHTDSTLWTILKMRKWLPNIFESLYLHITSDLFEQYISNK